METLKPEMSEERAYDLTIVEFVGTLSRYGINTNDQFQPFIKWAIGDDWAELSMKDWPLRFGMRHNKFSDNVCHEFFELMCEAYLERSEDDAPI